MTTHEQKVEVSSLNESQPTADIPPQAADVQDVARGETGEREVADSESGESDPFFLVVPDHVIAAGSFVYLSGPAVTDRRGGALKGLAWLIHAAVIAQRKATVTLPDWLLGQVVWGGRRQSWPRNWRKVIVRFLDSAVGKALTAAAWLGRDRPCPHECPMHQRWPRHGHVTITIRAFKEGEVDWARVPAGTDPVGETFLRDLELCGDEAGEKSTYSFAKPPGRRPAQQVVRGLGDAGDFKPDSTREDHLRRRWTRGTASAYLPLFLFGPSPRVGLNRNAQWLVKAIVAELTREPGRKKTGRDDRAQIVVGGRAVRAGEAASYPDLVKGGRYVGFNGNGSVRKARLRGRGYSLVAWLRRARYVDDFHEPNDKGRVVPAPTPPEDVAKATRPFLKDLAHVARVFGLTVAAWHPKRKQWLALSALPPLLKSADGRRWLSGMRLRIYTTEDFLARWRAVFAERMGFTAIPLPGEETAVETGPAASAAGLRTFLVEQGITQDAFAAAVGVKKAAVSRRINGDLKWSPDWSARVKACIDRHPEWVKAKQSPVE